MTPWMPQGGAEGASPDGALPFLTPAQYQLLIQQYFQSMMLAGGFPAPLAQYQGSAAT